MIISTYLTTKTKSRVYSHPQELFVFSSSRITAKILENYRKKEWRRAWEEIKDFIFPYKMTELPDPLIYWQKLKYHNIVAKQRWPGQAEFYKYTSCFYGFDF